MKMSLYSNIVTVVILGVLKMSVSQDPCDIEHGHYCYELTKGCRAECWKTDSDFAKCGSTVRQSPINLPDDVPINPSLIATLSTQSTGSAMGTLKNTGHNIQLTFDDSNKYSIDVGNGNTYDVLQLHFHWGMVNAIGSEHTVESHQYSMEMHIVAKASDTDFAVFGFFFQVDTDNPYMVPITTNLPKLPKEGDEQKDVELSVMDLTLESRRSTFYRYLGSLTTPACNEIVTWTVFTEPIKLSQIQLNGFRNINLGDSNNNFRPVVTNNPQKPITKGWPGLIGGSKTCTWYGDPHYQMFYSFGKAMAGGTYPSLNHQGHCVYEVAVTTSGAAQAGVPEFGVYVNSKSRGNLKVTYTEAVYVYYKSAKIVMNRSPTCDITIGGSNTLSFSNNDVTIKCESGTKQVVELKTKGFVFCTVTYDGDQVGTISILEVYNKTPYVIAGLCGRFDDSNPRNDFCKKGVNCNPSDTEIKNEAWQAEVGDSYITSATGGLVPCPTETQAVHGRKKRSTIHHAQKRCHALNFDGGVCGPLHKCAKKYPDLAKTLYNDCVFDITHISHGQKQIVCNNLEILVDECEQKLAHRIKWRKHFKCEVECHNNFIYSDKASVCKPTCGNPHAHKKCHVEHKEGCHCPDGQVEVWHHCVDANQCKGDGQCEVGEKWLSEDCKIQFRCLKHNKLKKRKSKGCPEGKKCKSSGGKGRCIKDKKGGGKKIGGNATAIGSGAGDGSDNSSSGGTSGG